MANNNLQDATELNNRIPLNQKVVFGIGMLANQLFPAALGIFMIVLIEGLNMNPLLYGLLGLIPKLIDAITDPLMGYISDHTVSRWGKRRPYVFIGAIISSFSFVMMWQLSADSTEMYNFYYFLAWSCAFWIGMTIFGVPFVAMGYEMSSDFHERTRLMAVAQWIGQWAWVIAPWAWWVIYNEEMFESAAAGAKFLSLWVGGLCMTFALVPAIFCTFTNTDDNADGDNKNFRIDLKDFRESMADFVQGIVITLRNKPFQKICIATFFIFNSFQTIAALSFIIIVHHMFNGSQDSAGLYPILFGSVGALFTCFLVIPVVSWFSQNYGKKLTFLYSQSISIVGYVLLWWGFSPETPWMVFIPLPLFSFGIGGLFTIMMSMTADICDMDELETGKRREGIFGAIYWWMVKLGTAIAVGTTGLLMYMTGYDPAAAVKSEESLYLLRLGYILIPCTGTLIAIFVMRNYDLNEKKANEIRDALNVRAVAAS